MNDQEINRRCAVLIGADEASFDPINNEDDLVTLMNAHPEGVDLSAVWARTPANVSEGLADPARKAAFHRAAALAYAALGDGPSA